MATFVLVHGSWHDGTAWQPTIQHLEGRGHKASALTIAGHGKRAQKNVNHAQCTKSIVDYIVDNSLTDIVSARSQLRWHHHLQGCGNCP